MNTQNRQYCGNKPKQAFGLSTSKSYQVVKANLLLSCHASKLLIEAAGSLVGAGEQGRGLEKFFSVSK